MIVLRSTYDSLRCKYWVLESQYSTLMSKWNALVDQINARGGREFLDGARIGATQFSQDDIKRLLVLCHPDKHDGKRIAQEMTQKLLALREQV